MLQHRFLALGVVLALLCSPLLAQSVVGSGSEIQVRTDQAIQADSSAVGKTFPATVSQDVQDHNGNVAIPKGSPAQVAVTKGSKANEVTLGLRSVTVNGHRYLLTTNKTTQQGGKSGIGMNKRTGEYVGGGALAGTLIKNLPLGGKPENGVSSGDGKVYANITDTSEVVEIDAKTATIARRWSTAPCKQPVPMAIDTAHHRLFSGCRSGVMAISDYQAGKIVATVPIGTGVDGAGFDAASGDAFASNADGTLTVIHQDSPDQYRVTENVQTPAGSRNMGLDPSNHRVFIVSAKFGPAPVSGTGKAPVMPGSFTLMVIERDPATR